MNTELSDSGSSSLTLSHLMLSFQLLPCVLQPAEQSMLTTLRLAQLFVESGFPPGVFSVVTGVGPTVGAALVRHPLVDKVACPFHLTASLGSPVMLHGQ